MLAQHPSAAPIETPFEAIASTGLDGVLRFAQNDRVFAYADLTKRREAEFMQ
jgi:hypothetical protein